jgi:hypothetical protein
MDFFVWILTEVATWTGYVDEVWIGSSEVVY